MKVLTRKTYQMNPNLLRAERKRHGWSQAEVAEALGIATKTVVRWELGQAVPIPYHRQKLSMLFGKTIQELGLLENTHKQAGEEAAPSNISEASAQTSFLADSAIPMHLKSANLLPKRDGLLILVKESLFTRDTVFIAALDDLSGNGKTDLALALTIDRQVQAHFRDGILWAKLGFRSDVLGVLAHWGMLLGITPSQIEDFNNLEFWERTLQAALSTRRMLLIIDNACNAEDALALRVGGPGCAHLLTTGLSEVALTFAQQGAIVISRLEGGDRVALLHNSGELE